MYYFRVVAPRGVIVLLAESNNRLWNKFQHCGLNKLWSHSNCECELSTCVIMSSSSPTQWLTISTGHEFKQLPFTFNLCYFVRNAKSSFELLSLMQFSIERLNWILCPLNGCSCKHNMSTTQTALALNTLSFITTLLMSWKYGTQKFLTRSNKYNGM